MKPAIVFLSWVAMIHAQDLSLATLRNYTQERLSSFDRDGANDDGGRKNPIKPGETRVLGDVQGPGVITHLWITIATPEHWMVYRSCQPPLG